MYGIYHTFPDVRTVRLLIHEQTCPFIGRRPFIRTDVRLLGKYGIQRDHYICQYRCGAQTKTHIGYA